LEAKPRGRKAVGHLLDTSIQKNIIHEEGFLAGYENNAKEIIVIFNLHILALN
jgi:hypothetical protein